MIALQNPAAQAFASGIESELGFAQILIRRNENGFELRQVVDRERDLENLRTLRENEIRAMVQFTAIGAFRPLKSAPNLPSGWCFLASDEAQLEFALSIIYPGAIADWFAVNFSKTLPTNYREFTNRQTGMYRITAMLTDAQAAPVIRACCHKDFCLKQRLWTVDGLEADSLAEKSLIPCLEPCAILLEFARKAMRLEQQTEKSVSTSEEKPSDINAEIREADFENPQNPRRLQWVREKQNVNG